jgi:predicted transcriptional regulator
MLSPVAVCASTGQSVATTLPQESNLDATHDIKFRFNPLSSRSKRVLGPLEGEIMDVVWEQGATTVSAVYKVLRDKKDIAYTTVMTTMSRLAKKNLLDQDKSSSSYVYTPVLARSDFERYVVLNVLRGLIDDYGDAVVDCFVEYLGDERARKQKERLTRALCR